MKAKSSFSQPNGISVVAMSIVGALSLIISAFIAWAFSCLGGAAFNVAVKFV